MTNDATAIRRRLRSLLILLWLFLAAAAVLAFAWSRGSGNEAAARLPVIKDAPAFELVNRDGSPTSLEDLEGKPWVADFVFTRCPGVCPILSKRMQELSADVSAEAVRLVSISVDPEHDTPERLEAYAREHQAGPNWLFLTGPKADVHRVIREGFMLVLDDSAAGSMAGDDGATADTSTDDASSAEGGAASTAGATEPIVHSNRFVLVDAENRIRGYYNAFDAKELEQLRRDLALLVD